MRLDEKNILSLLDMALRITLTNKQKVFLSSEKFKIWQQKFQSKMAENSSIKIQEYLMNPAKLYDIFTLKMHNQTFVCLSS